MTDEQIIEELKDEIGRANYLESYYIDTVNIGVFQHALDLINRQKAEKERLLQKLQRAKSEAIKEFADRLKSISIGLEIGDDKKIKVMVVSTIAIDKIAKEMTEVKENEK